VAGGRADRWHDEQQHTQHEDLNWDPPRRPHSGDAGLHQRQWRVHEPQTHMRRQQAAGSSDRQELENGVRDPILFQSLIWRGQSMFTLRGK
jgi:hypothetical protein